MTREERNNAIKVLRNFDLNNPKVNSLLFSTDEITNAFNMAIKALEQESILDKIRAEIETKYGQCDICEYFEDYDYEENDISEYRPIGNIADILQMFDKYKSKKEQE